MRLIQWCATLIVDGKWAHQLLVYAVMGMLVFALWFELHIALSLLVIALIAFTALVLVSAWQLTRARDNLWCAACLSLENPHQSARLSTDAWILLAYIRTLRRLTVALDAARRENYELAATAVSQVHRERLQPSETQLLDAVRALISLGLDDQARAAHQALDALPTGSQALDTLLGRKLVAQALKNPAQLETIQKAWHRAKVDRHFSRTLERLDQLVRLHVDPSGIESLTPDQARELGDEAQALGDDSLAAQLHARARASLYR